MASIKGFRGEPTARRRRDSDAALLDAQKIIRLHGRGKSIRSIARVVGLPRTSVHGVIVEYRRAAAQSGDAEMDTLASKYEGGMSCENARTPDDVRKLNDLEYYRDRDADCSSLRSSVVTTTKSTLPRSNIFAPIPSPNQHRFPSNPKAAVEAYSRSTLNGYCGRRLLGIRRVSWMNYAAR